MIVRRELTILYSIYVIYKYFSSKLYVKDNIATFAAWFITSVCLLHNYFLILYLLYITVVHVYVFINHKRNAELPLWFNNALHEYEFKKRHRETIYNLISMEGIVTHVFSYGLFSVLYMLESKKKYKFYTSWAEMETLINEMVKSIPNFNTYDGIIGVDYGGALIAEYIKSKHSHRIKNIGYIRPHKQRSNIKPLFWLQLMHTYLDVFYHMSIKTPYVQAVTEPYYTYIKWSKDFTGDSKKYLIVDDGLLSGSTAKACIDYCESYFSNKNIDFDMYVLHGFDRIYKNKLYVYQAYQLAYFPWGQT